MRLAAIDIGTNSIHLVIVEVTSRFTFEVLEDEKRMVKLGTGVFSDNHLNKTAFEKGIETIRRYVRLADQRGCDEIITAATSAIREARNGGEFLDQLTRETGLEPQVISGKEEARLILMAVRNAIAIESRRVLVIDIGGGSTEFALGDKEQFVLGRSLKLGVLRLLDHFPNTGKLQEAEIEKVRSFVRKAAAKTVKKVKQKGFDLVVGTSGTIRNLGEAAYFREGGRPLRSVNAEKVNSSTLADISSELALRKPKDRVRIEGISEKRQDSIHLGAVLLSELLRMLEVEEITLCDASLREGLIHDHIERYGFHLQSMAENHELKTRSVVNLALKFGVDLEQKRHVAFLAGQLYDQLAILHGFGGHERSLLDAAAHLYGIGQFIGFRRYHKHSRYIINHSLLRGFNREEIILIGHLARYHRKGRPKKKHGKFRKLPKKERFLVKALSGILRIAVGLDKTKNQLVKGVKCRLEEDTLFLETDGEANLNLEIWDAQRKSKLLARTFQKDVKILPAQKELL